MKIYAALGCLVVLVAAISVVQADDRVIPPWRDLEGSTYQRWEFGTSAPLPVPDEMINPYYLDGATVPGPSIQVTPEFGEEWYPTWGGRDGVWPLSGAIGVIIPNNPVPNDFKWLQIQLTWVAEIGVPNSIPQLNVSAVDVSGMDVPFDAITLEDTIDTILLPAGVLGAGEFWHHTTYLYKIAPNPMEETICIVGTIMVDELVIDTYCIPEPATMSLLAIGGLALLRRRRH